MKHRTSKILGLLIMTSILLSGTSVQAANETLTLFIPLDYQVVQCQTPKEGEGHFPLSPKNPKTVMDFILYHQR